LRAATEVTATSGTGQRGNTTGTPSKKQHRNGPSGEAAKESGQPTTSNMRNMPNNRTRDRQQPQTAAKAREDGKVDGHRMEAGRPWRREDRLVGGMAGGLCGTQIRCGYPRALIMTVWNSDDVEF
jgi:hypothetical protein